MPYNKSETIHKQQNHDALKEEAVTVEPDKARNRPPSLNKINKNNQT